MPQTVIVVPCYNEANRLCLEGFKPLLERPEMRLLFVNDGSSDGTGAMLAAFCAGFPGRAQQMELPRNGGKAEAVRQGLLRAWEEGAEVMGFLDADLATRAEEMVRLVRVISEHPSDPQVLLGARVKLLGRHIQRSQRRHVLGRIFATFASWLLGLPVYDTQCGAKLFRRHPAFLVALETPFHSRWVFDVELIGRLVRGTREIAPIPLEAFLEEPLTAWQDVRGSKLGPGAMMRAALDLLTIRRALGRWPAFVAPGGQA